MKRNERFAGNRNVDWRSKGSCPLPDARLKIIIRQKARLKDARDRLNLIAKRTDARQKLLRIKANKINWKKHQPSNVFLTRTINNTQLQNKAGRFQESNAFPSTVPRLQRTVPGNVRIGNRLGIQTKSKFYAGDLGRRPPFKKNDGRIVSENKKLTITATNDTTENLEMHVEGDDDLEHMTLDDLPTIKNLKQSILSTETSRFSPANLSTSLQSRLSPLDSSTSLPGSRVIVSNLHADVTQGDIQELFGEIGPLRKATLNKHGFAEVTFFELSDALKACEVYNNRQLDGKPMHVKLITPGTYVHNQSSASQSYLDNSSSRSAISPDIDVIRRALFRKGTSTSSSQQPMFTITMAKK